MLQGESHCEALMKTLQGHRPGKEVSGRVYLVGFGEDLALA